MRNIWKIFTTDIRRISNNVVAVVIIMGLSILPALYAWFNIFSNWDPYEPAATSQLKVAVASDDAGAEIMGLSLNVGDSVLEALGANTTIGWVFPETTEEALEGVKNSDYYAALIIPETFTQEMLGFIDGEVDHPTIYYYENEKKNGIAPKITGKAKNAVQEQVNATFISTVAEAVMKAGNALSVVNAGGQTSVEESLDTDPYEMEKYGIIAAVFSAFLTSRALTAAFVVNMAPSKKRGLLYTFSQAAAGRAVTVSSSAVLLLCVIFSFFRLGITALIPVLGLVLTAVYFSRTARKQFGGISGDLCGWLIHMSELALLFCFLAALAVREAFL